MDGKSTSPRRPRGPGAPINPSVAEEYGHAENQKDRFGGSSRSSLFGLFRRQPSRSSLKPSSKPPMRGSQSLRSTAGESFSAAFENMSFNTSGSGLESPQHAKDTANRVEHMLKAAEGYRKAIEKMSEAAAEFGSALYECADTKGAAAGQTPLPDHFVDADLQAAGGLHLLVSNHCNILASSLNTQVVSPVRRDHAEYVRRIEAREAEFKTALRQRMQVLHQSDSQRKDTRSRRGVDLLAYRSTLLDLTSQIDDINRLKFEFLSDIHTFSIGLAESLHSSLASAVTAEIEVFEGIARKGWSGGGLDGLLASCPDPFEPRNSKSSSELLDSSENKSNAYTLNGRNLGRSGSTGTVSRDHHNGNNNDNDDNEHTTNGNTIRPASSSSSAKSPNLFSIIPPGTILPPEQEDDDDDNDSASRHTDIHERRASTNSDISEIGDLTLTPT